MQRIKNASSKSEGGIAPARGECDTGPDGVVAYVSESGRDSRLYALERAARPRAAVR